MKHMKRFMALFAALALVLAMAAPAFAEKIDTSNHSFSAYKIFSASLDDGKLTGIEWGADVDGNAILAALRADPITGSEFNDEVTTASKVAEVLSTWKGETNEKTLQFAKIVAKHLKSTATPVTGTNGQITFSETGYYLIVDTTNTENVADAKNLTLLNVAEARKIVTIQAKGEYPTVEKKVKENIKYTSDDSYGTGYNDTADYNIGDSIPFKLIGTVPDMSQYSSYKYTFHDTLAKSFNAPSKGDVKVYVSSDKAGTGKTEITEKFSVTVDATKNEITVSTDELNKIDGVTADKYILVEYSAVLNSNAAINNDNVRETTEGNVNKVYLTYSNNPNGSGEGKTIEDKVIVFTYKVGVTKVDATNNNAPLKGVQFKLYKKTNETEKKWVQVDENGKVTGWVNNEASGSVLESDENGKFSVIGLDNGSYWIKETKGLPGYNAIEDTEVKVVADTSNGQNGQGATNELTSVKVNDGTDITIENRIGATLPGTGGIGTTIFYLIGGGLMVAAAVLLIAKKRMENK